MLSPNAPMPVKPHVSAECNRRRGGLEPTEQGAGAPRKLACVGRRRSRGVQAGPSCGCARESENDEEVRVGGRVRSLPDRGVDRDLHVRRGRLQDGERRCANGPASKRANPCLRTVSVSDTTVLATSLPTGATVPAPFDELSAPNTSDTFILTGRVPLDVPIANESKDTPNDVAPPTAGAVKPHAAALDPMARTVEA